MLELNGLNGYLHGITTRKWQPLPFLDFGSGLYRFIELLIYSMDGYLSCRALVVGADMYVTAIKLRNVAKTSAM